MSKATDFINNKCYQLGNPVEPLIFKADALEAISIDRRKSCESVPAVMSLFSKGEM